jgi:hypothetical protein
VLVLLVLLLLFVLPRLESTTSHVASPFVKIHPWRLSAGAANVLHVLDVFFTLIFFLELLLRLCLAALAAVK